MERARDAKTIEVVDGLAEQRFDDVRRLLFAYMVSTELDAGRPLVSSADELHPVLAAELADPRATYSPPGTVFLALVDLVAVGCLGLQLVSPDTAEFKRFYVEPAARRLPVAGRSSLRPSERRAPSAFVASSGMSWQRARA